MLTLDPSKAGGEVLWQGPGEQDQEFTHDTEDTLNSVISTPVMDGPYVLRHRQRRPASLSRHRGNRQAAGKTDALLKEHAMYGTAFFVKQRQSLLHHERQGRARDREAVATGLR